jgi:thiamine phosphate synthase YjbQ (UPF0047 family)
MTDIAVSVAQNIKKTPQHVGSCTVFCHHCTHS